MSLVAAGKYVARVGGGIIVYETKNGALCAAIPCTIAEGPETDKELKHTATIVLRDGTLNTRTIDTLKEVFGWDGADPFWLTEADLSEARFEIVVQDDPGKNDDGSPKLDQQGNQVFYSKVQWLNPLGQAMKMPEPADRKSVLAKYGSKFRALAGGTAVKAPAKNPPPAAKKSPPPAAPAGPTATMEEAWESCQANHPEQAEEIWSKAIAKLFPNKTNSDLTPADWGKLKLTFDDNIPF